MRLGLVLLALAGLAGCARSQVPGPAAVLPVLTLPLPDTCGAAPFAGLVGQPATALERVLILRPVRLIRGAEPVAALPGRIGFRVDGAGRIIGIVCG